MLRTFLKSLARARGAKKAPIDEYPAERIARLQRAHERVPINAHLEILFGTMRVGEYRLRDLVDRCISEAAGHMPVLKAFHRPLASFFLSRYFLQALSIDGMQAECGVLTGLSALLNIAAPDCILSTASLDSVRRATRTVSDGERRTAMPRPRHCRRVSSLRP